MAEISFLRHAAWIGPDDFNYPIHIIGCGAVGSHVAVLLTKMGVHSFNLYDADEVEEHNLANQEYLPEHVGVNKAEALAKVINAINPRASVNVVPKFWDSSMALEGLVILATDSMSSRKAVADYLLAQKIRLVSGLFEIRLSFDYGVVNIMNLDSQYEEELKRFSSTLVDDSLVEEGPCNRKICTTLVAMTSAYLVHQVCAAQRVISRNESWTCPKTTAFDLTNTKLSSFNIT